MLLDVLVVKEFFEHLKSNVVAIAKILIRDVFVFDLYNMAAATGQPNVVDSDFLSAR